MEVPNMFDNPTFSDIKIRQIYEGCIKEYHGHRVVLCANSRWFLNALTGSYKESDSQVIKVHNDEPGAFKIMLEVIYGGRINLGSKEEQTKKCLKLIELWAISEKYFVPRLKTLVESRFDPSNITIGVEDLVKKFYDVCMVTDSVIGQSIARAYINYANNNSKATVEIVKTYPIFATDLVIASVETRLFPPGFRMSCRECTKENSIMLNDTTKDGHCIECGLKQEWSENLFSDGW